jgi:HK97 family phage prohead protease
MNQPKFYFNITKVDEDQRTVEGYASTEALDSQGQIVEKDAMSKAMEGYMEWANLREMHQPSAVGTVPTAKLDEKGMYITGKVVDDNAWKKVKEGVYKGFSIGGRVTKMIGNKIKELELVEISLVDRPANPECKIELVKVDKVDATAKGDEPAEKKTEPTDLKKMLADVGELAYIMQNIAWVRNCIESDAQWQGNEQKQEIANRLAGVLSILKDSAKDLLDIEITAETSQEEMVQYADLAISVIKRSAPEPQAPQTMNKTETTDLEKKGAKFSADTEKAIMEAMGSIKVQLKAVEDMIAASKEPEEKADTPSTVAKVDPDIAKDPEFKKLAEELETVKGQMKTLMSQPMPVKAVAPFAVSKDFAGMQGEDVVKKFEDINTRHKELTDKVQSGKASASEKEEAIKLADDIMDLKKIISSQQK